MTDKTVRVRVPCSSANLGSGFGTLGLALKRYNYVELSVVSDRKQESIGILGIGHGAACSQAHCISSDLQYNLIAKASKRVFNEVGKCTKGLRVVATNSIPPERGLGSSAAAIVSGMVAANELIDGKLLLEDLMDFALDFEPSPDNLGAAFYGGLVVSASGCNVARTGHSCRSLKVPWPPNIKIVATVTNLPCRTDVALEKLPPKIGRNDAVFNIERAALFVAAICQGQYGLISEALRDGIGHQQIRCRFLPGSQLLINELNRHPKLLGACLSGSGTAVIAFFDERAVSETEARSIVCEISNLTFETYSPKVRFYCEVLAVDVDGATVVEDMPLVYQGPDIEIDDPWSFPLKVHVKATTTG